jgi:ATP-dependent protease ClpP protease subunit
MSKKSQRPRRGPAREIAVIGELFEEAERDIVQAILETSAGSEVDLYIDSAGGSIYAALAVAALIRFRKLKARAIVLSECSSSAVLIFAACERRLVAPHSVFLFHRARWRSEKDVRTDEAASWAEHFLWLEREVDRYQAKLFGVDSTTLERWTQANRYVLGSELVSLGLAEIVEV